MELHYRLERPMSKLTGWNKIARFQNRKNTSVHGFQNVGFAVLRFRLIQVLEYFFQKLYGTNILACGSLVFVVFVFVVVVDFGIEFVSIDGHRSMGIDRRMYDIMVTR